jgi:HPt (histidine-containing phosphotransfer) domain-containing protein
MTIHPECWDLPRALRSFGGDREYLSEIAGIFSAACPALLHNIEESIASRNYSSVADSAHLVWSGARTLSAAEAMNAALAVEMMARGNEFHGIENAYLSLQQEIGRLVAALAEFRSGRTGLPGPKPGSITP